MIEEMESYRGKISSDIDNVIDWQLKKNLSAIINRIRQKKAEYFEMEKQNVTFNKYDNIYFTNHYNYYTIPAALNK